MSVIDRYWEWRRRRALRVRERTHALALVVDALIERRGFPRRPGHQEEQAPPAGAAAAVLAHPDRAPSEETGETPREPGRHGPGRHPTRRADGEAPRTRAEHSRDAPGCPAILAAIGGSESSAEVGKEAVDLARSLRAALVVLSFINARRASRMGIYRSLALAELERDSGIAARQTKKLADESGIECEVWLAWAPLPSRAIVGAAREVEADCIVIGSPGASVVDRLFAKAVGGTHEKVIRQARCPVLSVR